MTSVRIFNMFNVLQMHKLLIDNVMPIIVFVLTNTVCCQLTISPPPKSEPLPSPNSQVTVPPGLCHLCNSCIISRRSQWSLINTIFQQKKTKVMEFLNNNFTKKSNHCNFWEFPAAMSVTWITIFRKMMEGLELYMQTLGWENLNRCISHSVAFSFSIFESEKMTQVRSLMIS